MPLKKLGEKRNELMRSMSSIADDCEDYEDMDAGPGFEQDDQDLSDASRMIRKKKSGLKKKKKIKREEDRSYCSYITKVFKTIHPGMQLDKKTTEIINTCCYHVMEEVCEQAAKCIARTNKKTLSSSDLQYAVKFLFPTELAQHAEMEGIMAVARQQGLDVIPGTH